MCGIICYVGNKEAAPIILDGLKTLEYRGYDSLGVCLLQDDLRIIKQKGSIKDFPKIQSPAKIGMGHTRWATHGAPTDVNAHPHSDCHGDIAVVHNGIIENYSTLKKLLISEGHVFDSDTDTEVLAHLIEKFYQGNIVQALVKALEIVEGTYGLAVMHKNHKEIVIARKGSPLVIGIGEGEYFAASDTTALLPYTKRVVYLQDHEIAILSADSFTVQDLDGLKLTKDVEEIKWTVDQVEKQGYKHFMLKEIMEQPESIANTLRGRIKDDMIKISISDIKNIKRILMVACGTSWHSALIGKHYIESLARIPVEVDYASEFRYRNPILTDSDLLVVISQSGETADTLAALKLAKSNNIPTLGIVNVVGSSIAREVDSGIFLHAGPEIGVASTKAFSCQVVALLLLALYIRQQQGLKNDSRLINQLSILPDIIRETLNVHEQIISASEELANVRNFLFLGRELNFPVALEGALKLKEISYIHAEGYPAAEMKHGPIALIDDDMPVVFIATKNALSEKIMSNIQEVKARKGKTLIVMNKDSPELERFADYKIIVPQVMNELSPLINVIPLQLLAYYIADLKGLDVDKPRNLAKSVTVE